MAAAAASSSSPSSGTLIDAPRHLRAAIGIGYLLPGTQCHSHATHMHQPLPHWLSPSRHAHERAVDAADIVISKGRAQASAAIRTRLRARTRMQHPRAQVRASTRCALSTQAKGISRECVRLSTWAGPLEGGSVVAYSREKACVLCIGDAGQEAMELRDLISA